MFTTFVATPLPEASTPIQQRRVRQKRHQVTRACQSCRVQRVKCDNTVPCGNCRTKGRHCSNKTTQQETRDESPSREIERLQQKIYQLEAERDEARRSQTLPTPPLSSENASPTSLTQQKRNWEGVLISTAYSLQRTWYGPFSLFYFISRMNTYLAAAFQQPHPNKLTQPQTVARLFRSLDYSLDDGDVTHTSHDHTVQSGQLTAVREEYFLNLFWQSHHCSLPILNESQFKEHCRSLWSMSGKTRNPSALVDIVLAMSVQYGMTQRSRTASTMDLGADDPTIAGRWYYRRCQTLLSKDLESPTISTVQCQVLSVIYLCCASFQNMAHSTLATAVRTANMIGLHREPPLHLPKAERELRKRLWWCLYAIESKTCMKLGRPFSVSLSSVSCELPADDHNTASTGGSDFAPLDEHGTWLTYNLQHIKLVLAARSIHTTLFDHCLELHAGEEGGVVIYDDAVALKRCADFLSGSIVGLKTWVEELPEILKTFRRDDGVPLSTDDSALAVEQFAPLWLQRQRLLLELLYHNLSMNLYRVFITYPTILPLWGSSSLLHATSAAEHGMALTNIMHQIMTQTDILAGWHEAFQWQWNAAITLVGYVLSSPSTDSATRAREALNRALTVFEVFGRSFAAAASAAAVVRGLLDKTDCLNMSHIAGSNIGISQSNSGSLLLEGNTHVNNDILNVMDDFDAVAMQEVLAARPVDMGYMPDAFNAGNFDEQFLPFMSF